MDLEKTIQFYLSQRGGLSGKPLLLGLSGGEDSLALAHCLLRLNISFHIAHFDHGWRESSQSEAEALQMWAAERQIPFYMARSSSPVCKEEAARGQRYAFFESIFDKAKFEALVLAHHQDDQVETVLKRVLEGASLPKLGGIKGVHQRGEMAIWRPILGVAKEKIRSYIKTHELTPIDDPTNRDPAYLRARMRTGLIPLLKEQLGKEITQSFLRLGRYGAELEDYLMRQTAELQPVEGPFGKWWDFSGRHPVEVRFVLRNIGAGQMVADQILEALAANKANHQVNFGGKELIVDRGNVFQKNHTPIEYKALIGPPVEGKPQDWRCWWQGKISINIPSGQVSFANLNAKFRKIQQQHQVPAFLRDTLPILCLDGEEAGEFLTGKCCYPAAAQSVTFIAEG